MSAPECPEFLDDLARKEWGRLVPILLAMRVLTEADQIALADLCQAYSTMIEAQTNLKSAGLLYKTQSGYIQQSPLLAIVHRCSERVLKLSREFGLTPAARVRLHAAAEPEVKANKWAAV